MILSPLVSYGAGPQGPLRLTSPPSSASIFFRRQKKATESYPVAFACPRGLEPPAFRSAT